MATARSPRHEIIDPSTVLPSFQAAYLNGEIRVTRGTRFKDLICHMDSPRGVNRTSFALLKSEQVVALVQLPESEPLDGLRCFDIGYAVPEPYRNQGLCKKAVQASIIELAALLAIAGEKAFYVEAIVAAENVASRRVAEQLISDQPEEITEGRSGKLAFSYLGQFKCSATR